MSRVAAVDRLVAVKVVFAAETPAIAIDKDFVRFILENERDAGGLPS